MLTLMTLNKFLRAMDTYTQLTWDTARTNKQLDLVAKKVLMLWFEACG